MNALPKLLYILQTIPIHVLPSFFKTYRQLCSNFLWSDRTHRISYNQLSRPKHLGGVRLPNLQNYQTAALLTRIVDWNVHAPLKDWIALEASFAKLPLNSLPWITSQHIPSDIRLHYLIGPTIQFIHEMCKQTDLSSTPGPLAPIKLNPYFPPGMHQSFLNDHWPSDQIRANQFFHQGKMLTAAQIATQIEKTSIPP